jgi:hypothetical protein
MNLTSRDRYILIGLLVVATLGAYWMLGLAPKRDKAAKLDKDIAAAQQQLDHARQEKISFARAQVAFPRMYASVGRLGKAVPSDDEVPSLLVQLNHAAADANVDFRSVELKADQLGQPPAASAPAPAPAAGATGATGAEGATGATGATGSSISGTATVAPPEFQKLPFEYKFEGGFYSLANLIHNVNALVESRNQALAVAGRLVTVEGFSMKRNKVTLLGTSYVLPAGQGLFGGASPQAPANADPAAPQAASAGAAAPVPPTAAVTGP